MQEASQSKVCMHPAHIQGCLNAKLMWAVHRGARGVGPPAPPSATAAAAAVGPKGARGRGRGRRKGKEEGWNAIPDNCFKYEEKTKMR